MNSAAHPPCPSHHDGLVYCGKGDRYPCRLSMGRKGPRCGHRAHSTRDIPCRPPATSELSSPNYETTLKTILYQPTTLRSAVVVPAGHVARPHQYHCQKYVLLPVCVGVQPIMELMVDEHALSSPQPDIYQKLIRHKLHRRGATGILHRTLRVLSHQRRIDASHADRVSRNPQFTLHASPRPSCCTTPL
jgi:hypothetical protein